MIRIRGSSQMRFLGYLKKWAIKYKKDKTELMLPLPVNSRKAAKFSPMTYQNPCITKMRSIVEHVIADREVSFQKLELVVLDAECGQGEQDDYDIQDTLSQLAFGLNYLLLVTDRPDFYEDFMFQMYEENGLVVQQVCKSVCKNVRGNFILDFERAGKVPKESMIRPGVIYMPVYKKPWEIGENLDIKVPVGYNTLVIEGVLSP